MKLCSIINYLGNRSVTQINIFLILVTISCKLDSFLVWRTPPPFTGPMSERPKPFRSLQLPTHFGVHFCTHHVLALVSTRRCVVFCTHLCTFSTQSFLESNVTLTNRRFGYGNQLANKVCLEIDPFCLKKKTRRALAHDLPF